MGINNMRKIMCRYKEIDSQYKKLPRFDVIKNEMDGVFVLVQNVGKISKTILEYFEGDATKKEIRDAVINTAAVCVRIIEELDDEAGSK